jgi:hypothetical protein
VEIGILAKRKIQERERGRWSEKERKRQERNDERKRHELESKRERNKIEREKKVTDKRKIVKREEKNTGERGREIKSVCMCVRVREREREREKERERERERETERERERERERVDLVVAQRFAAPGGEGRTDETRNGVRRTTDRPIREPVRLPQCPRPESVHDRFHLVLCLLLLTRMCRQDPEGRANCDSVPQCHVVSEAGGWSS